jgi:hypothetical protein
MTDPCGFWIVVGLIVFAAIMNWLAPADHRQR